MNEQLRRNRSCAGASRPDRLLRAVRIGTFFLLASMALVCVAFGEDEIISGVGAGMNQIWNLIRRITIPVGAVAIAVCFLFILFDGERGMEKGKKYMIRVILVVAVVFMAPLIMKAVGMWFNPSAETYSNASSGIWQGSIN